MMTQRSKHAAVVAALLFTAAAARAGTYPVYGPRNFVRDISQPAVVTEAFTVAAPQRPYLLRIVNGGANGALEKVTSAIIKVNGQEIAGTNDFNAKTPPALDKPVTLSATNELSVELRGNPGSGLTLSVLGEDNDPPVIVATVTPPPNEAGWNRETVTVTFTCSDALTSVTQCTPPITVSAEGAAQILAGTATDSAGNTATRNVTINLDKTPPSGAIVSPHNGAVVRNATLDLTGNASDSLSGAVAVRCGMLQSAISGGTFQCQAPLDEGGNDVAALIFDRAGNSTLTNVVAVQLDTVAPSLRIDTPVPDAHTNASLVGVTGVASDNDQIATLTVNGQPLFHTSDLFEAIVAVSEGSNTITAVATDRAGNTTTRTSIVNRLTIPKVSINSPADLSTVSQAAVTISGSVTGAPAVKVNGVAAIVSGSSFTARDIPLAQGRTVITATVEASGTTATDSIIVYRDSIPPRVVLRSPADGATVYQSPFDVSGMIDDIVVGTINSGQATVTVNGRNAEVANRAFVAHDLPLVAGLNTLTVVATDQGGNSVTLTSHVTYQPAAGQPKIVVVSGNDQLGSIGARLAAPLVVKVVDGAGAPLAARLVTFTVEENNGFLTGSGQPARTVSVATDAQGRAAADWTLGMRAGAGNNRVGVTAAGVSGSVQMSATAHVGLPSLIVVDSGNNQFGQMETPLPRPLIAVVVDAGNNRASNVPVTFSAGEGGGTFGGQPSITVMTDSDGRAIATPQLGPSVRNTFTAQTAGSPSAAVFVANGRVAGPAAETRITGLILDNTDQPIPGVTVRIDGTVLVAQSDAQGQFTIASAPVGYVKLLIDGSTTQRPGTWPTLEYAMYTITGANNTLEMPIHLLPIDVRRGLFVDEVTGGTLTIPELPGFSLTVKPGSATFPGGGRTGTVSATIVHADKIPMAPGFGQQPRFIVTIQPPGVHFDPPASITFPNVDGLAPGEITEMYSFDHDLGQFVSIGTGSVSEDGTVLRSDPGVGILKGGWHCGGNPASSGTPFNCPQCKKCDGATGNCVADPAQNGSQCQNNICKTCQGGSCLPDNTKVPPQNAPDDCKKEVCQGGSIQTVEDLTETAAVHDFAEENFCAPHIPSCLRARDITNEALAWAEQQIPLQGWPANSLHNGIADAARHAYWMCRTAQELGVDFARGLGNAHEEDSGAAAGYGGGDGNNCEEKKMDLHNNGVGRNLSLTPPTNCCCAEKVLQSLNLLTTCCGQ